MTLYTPKQRFPYPASEQEYGNAAAQLEALAQAADAALDRVSANWTALRHPGYILMQLTSNVNVPVANGLTGINPGAASWTTVSISSGMPSSFPFGSNSPNIAQYGWWDISIHVASQPTGAANAGTRRYLQAQKSNKSNQTGTPGDNNIFIWEDEETSVGGVTGAELNFLTYVDAKFLQVAVGFLHQNTSSGVDILAANTFLQATQITGAIS